MATFSNTTRPGYVWDATDNVWYPIGVGGHSHSEIAKTIADAKGDLIVGTAADTVDRLAVGADGSTLVANSANATGLGWSATPSASNPVLNSAFQNWQRGTSISVAASSTATYSADRWNSNTGANGASTISRQATGDTTNLPNIQYCARVQKNVSQTGTSSFAFYQSFESINSIPFAGKTVTFSFYARKGANYSSAADLLSAKLLTGTGTDQNVLSGYTGLAQPIIVSATLTTSWQRFSGTATLSSSLTELSTGFEYTPVGTAGAADYFEVTGVQIDVGSVALPFRTYAATLQGELAACQRYYYRNTSGSLYGLMVNAGYFTSSTAYYPSVQFPVPMRVAPTSIDFSTLTAQDQTGATYAMSSLAIDTATVTPFGTSVNSTVSGATAGRYGRVLANNSTTAYLGFSAEL